MKELTEEELRNVIEGEFPEMPITSFRFVNAGWNNYIVVVNEGIIFRIPKIAGNAANLRSEILLTSRLQKCPYSIPNYRYISRGSLFFGGYPIIHGDFLSNSHSYGEDLLRDFKVFLSYLRSVSPDSLEGTDIKVYDPESWKKKELSLLNRFQKSLMNLIPVDYFTKIEDQWEKVSSGLGEYDISLIHGDLYRNNVIISENHRNLVGVIDWSESVFGDVALDYAALGIDFQWSFTSKLLMAEKKEHMDEQIKRINFYRNIDPLYYAHYMAKMGRSKEAERYCQMAIESWRKIRWI